MKLNFVKGSWLLFSLVFGLFLFSGIALAQTPNPTPTPNPNIETDAKQAPVPGIDAVVDLLGGDPNVSGSNPIGDDDVFGRANSPQDLGFMKIMWDLTRKMSNVIVVIAFFMAAVATTLNFQISTYGIKKTLPSVLLATLYANFSYAIAQVFNNINHAIFNAFTGNANSATQLMANFIKGPLDNQWSGINLEAGWDNIQAIIVLVFMAVLALGLWLLVFLFYIRNYILAMLVAIAPLAFMSLALPFTASAFRKWWDQFIKWTFFPAVAGFWLYLGAVALLAMGTTGGLVALVFTGLILWTAIRTPFTLGAGVGAVAGYVTGYAQRGASMAAKGAAATGKFGGNLVFGGTVDQVRLRAAAVYEQTALGRAARARRQARARLEKNLELERGRPAWTPTSIADQNSSNPWRRLNNMLQNELATNVGRMELDLAAKEDRNRREGAGGKSNAAATPRGQAALARSANAKLEADTAEAQLKQAQLQAESDARRNNPLSLILAQAQEAAAGLEDTISGITSLYKKQALEGNEELRQLRRIGIARKELGEKAYQREMGKIKGEVRTGSKELTAAVEKEIVQAVGHTGNTGDAGLRLRRVMATLSGDSQDVEETIKSLAEKDALTYQADKLIADDLLNGVSSEYVAMMGQDENGNNRAPKLINHDLGSDEYIAHLAKAGAITVSPSGRIRINRADKKGQSLQVAIERMGLSHLKAEDQIEAIRQHTHADNLDVRQTSTANALKSLGKSRAGSFSTTESDVTESTAVGMTIDAAKDAAAGLAIMDTPGARQHLDLHSGQPDSNVSSIKQVAAVANVHGFVSRFMKKPFNALSSGLDTLIKGISPTLIMRGYAADESGVRDKIRSLQITLPDGNTEDAQFIFAGLASGRSFLDKDGNRIQSEDIAALAKGAIVGELNSGSHSLHLKDDTTGIIWSK